MLTQTIKRYGNSKCLPLDKTILAILGIDEKNNEVVIDVSNNQIIIRKKINDFEEKRNYLLNEKQWDDFNKVLNTKIKTKNLKKLLLEPGVLDE